MMRKFFAVLGLVALVAVAADAATLVVRQDSSGDYETITEACAAAEAGDIILVGPGAYVESIIIDKDLTLESEDGADVTEIDGVGVFRPLQVTGAATVLLRGLAVTRGYADNGAALFIWNQAQVEIDDCVFYDNHAWESNAVHVRHVGTRVQVSNCEFLGNSAEWHSAALSVGQGGYLDVEECRFVGNVAGVMSGAVNATDSYLDIRRSYFIRNRALGTGALVCIASTGHILRNTFHANHGRDHGSVYICDDMVFAGNIITGNEEGVGLETDGIAVRSNNLYYNNVSGAISGDLLADDEIVADPLFCDVGSEDFSVGENSPALVEINGVGGIGAAELGCESGVVPTRSSTWGDVKQLYR